ncbi:probable carboxylesterase 2, partial [Tanacetum coccineum]
MFPVSPSEYISTSDEVPIEVHGSFRIQKDGHIERLTGTNVIAAGIDQLTESFASSTYHPTLNLLTMESNVISVSLDYRQYPIPIPYKDSYAAFSSFKPQEKKVKEKKRKEATKWVANHSGGNGPEAWLYDYADFKNVFLAGDSSGANIAHNIAIRVGLSPSNSVNDINLKGVIMLHPYFGGKDPIGEESGKDRDFKVLADLTWKLVTSLHIGLDDPLFNP